jgi:hypothetical protein
MSDARSLQFNHVFRKDVYESNIDFPCYIIVEGVGLNQKIKVEHRDGQELSEDIRKDVLEQFSNHNSQNKLLSALKAIVCGLPEEYDDKHTNNLIERCQTAIDQFEKGEV